jgi:hypothetical protein
MPAKRLKPPKPPLRRKSPPLIAEGEIDVLRFMVRSALGRDAQKRKAFTEISFGDVRIDFVRHELFRNGIQLQANAREFQLLMCFLQHEGEVVSRDQLLTDVWGFEQTPNTRSVDNYILSCYGAEEQRVLEAIASRKSIPQLPSHPSSVHEFESRWGHTTYSCISHLLTLLLTAIAGVSMPILFKRSNGIYYVVTDGRNGRRRWKSAFRKAGQQLFSPVRL